MLDPKYAKLFPQPKPATPYDLSLIYPNQLNNAWMGVCGLQPFVGNVSSSRLQMESQHIGQCLPIEGADERMIQTTLDKEYAKYSFSVSMPENGRILKIFKKYPSSGLAADSIQHNPLTTVIYESEEGEIGYFNLTDYRSEHQYFGFRYEAGAELSNLAPDRDFKKGDVFLKSPLVSKRGGWKFGVTANMALFSHPGTAEDSVLVRAGFLKKMRFKMFRQRVFEYGKTAFPKNLYGKNGRFKFMPDIGEKVAEHGYLCALGQHDEGHLSFVEQSTQAMATIDEFDETVFVGPGGTVVDVQVFHDMKDDKNIQPEMDEQALKYYLAGKRYYQSIYDYYKRLRAARGDGLRMTDAFHHLIVEAMSVITPTKARLIHRRTPIDRFRIVVTVEYDIEPNIGFKMAGLSGDKSIMCKIVADEDMPVDEHGNVADFISSEDSTVGRNNSSRIYEQFVGSVQVQLHREICQALGITPKTVFARAVKHLQHVDQSIIDEVWATLIRFYTITRQETAQAALTTPNVRNFLATIVAYGVNLIWPTDNEVDNPLMALELEREFRPLHAPISYRVEGRAVRTLLPIRIGPMYVILLEKIGDDWSACSSTKTHYHGVPAQTSMGDKYRNPARETPVRATGEAEVRLLVSYTGPESAAEQIDRNSNPQTHALITRGLFEAEKVGNIGQLVDRNKHPYGGAKSLQMAHHYNLCMGWEFAYRKATVTC